MSRRASAKRIDYSKFATSGSSTDDEDFEESSIPLPRKRNKEPVKKKETKNNRAAKNEKVEISKSKLKEKKPRTSRTSNAERIYQEELSVALDESKGNVELFPSEHDDVMKEIITINESDDERVMRIVACKKTQDTEDSEAFADTIPINENVVKSDNKKFVQQSLTTTNTEDSEEDIRKRKVRKRNGRRVANPFIADDDEDVTTTTNSECTDVESPLKKFKELDSYTRLKSPSIPLPSTSTTRLQGDVTNDDDVNDDVTNDNRISTFKRSSKLKSNNNNHNNNNNNNNNTNNTNSDEERATNNNKHKPTTPSFTKNNIYSSGKLRLGLSRNRKVTKPLHQTVSFKVL